MAITMLPFSSLLVFEWIWSMTWDIGHVPIAAVITILLLGFKKAVPWKYAVGITIAISLLQFALYTGIVAILTYGTAVHAMYTQLSHSLTISPLRSCITVGLIYTILYEIVAWVLYHIIKINALRYGGIALIANMSSALINYWIIRIFM